MPNRRQSEGIDVRSIDSKAVSLKEENQQKKKCKKTRCFFLENGAYHFSRQRPSLRNTTATTRAPISRVKRTSKAISFFSTYTSSFSYFLFSFKFRFLFIFSSFVYVLRSLLSFFSFLFTSRFVNGQPGRGSTFPTKQSDECATQLNR